MVDKATFKLDIMAGSMKKATMPVLGQVVKTAKKGVYAVKEQAIVGKQYIVDCPVCGKPILVTAIEPKVVKVMHKTCNAPIIIKFVASRAKQADNPEKIESEESEQGHSDRTESDNTDTGRGFVLGSPTNAKLIWWSRTGRKKFILRHGKNYIGRKDDDNPSDLSFKDEYASARSICIDVNETVRGYTFHLTVERAANSVLVNGKEQAVGSSFDLNYDDIIEFGYPLNRIRLILKPIKT